MLVEPFLRGTKRVRTDHAGVGVGLGLAIVKSITQAHDGTLTLTPRAAGGLRVAVQLPASATAASTSSRVAGAWCPITSAGRAEFDDANVSPRSTSVPPIASG